MPYEKSSKKRIIYFILFIFFFLICIPIIILYSMGYTFDSGTFGLSGHGGIYVSVPESDVNVYIGNDLKKTTGFFQKEILVKNLRPKEYLVVVGNEVFWPWAKIINVTEGEVSALYPLLVPKEISFKKILKNDDTYDSVSKLFLSKPKVESITNSFSTSTLDSVIKFATLIDPETGTSTRVIVPADAITKGKMEIWKNRNFIFATWLGSDDRIPAYFCYLGNCRSTIVIYVSSVPMGRLDFYPGRDDAIILTLGNALYAIEADTRPYHNFYPIYKGENPDFRIEGTILYVKDGSNLSSVEL